MKKFAMLSLVLFAITLIPVTPAEACCLGKCLKNRARSVETVPGQPLRNVLRVVFGR